MTKSHHALAIGLLAASLAVACAAPKPPKYELKLVDRHTRLPNGMRIIFLPDTTTELVEVDVRYQVGSKEDYQGKAGLAHLVEHLMFQQRPNGPDTPPIWEYLRQNTLFVNAYTNWDSTHYMAMAKKEKLEALINIEGTRLALGCETITQEEFERELEVVRNEMRFRLGDPNVAVEYRLLAEVYPPGHPYRREVGGDDHELANITLEDVCRFMKDYYVPERATLIVAGNATEAQIKEYAAKYLVGIPARSGAPLVEVPPIELKHKRVDFEADVEEAAIWVGWKLPPRMSEDGYTRNFLIQAVTGRTAGFASKWDFASAVYPEVLGGEHAPVFLVKAHLKDPKKVDEALDFVKKSVRTAHKGFEDHEYFKEIQAHILSSLVYEFETLTSRTNLFGDYAQFDVDRKFFAGELERVQKVQGDRIAQLIKSTLDWDKAVVLVVKPKEGVGRYARAAHRQYKAGATHDPSRNMLKVDPAEARRPLEAPKFASPVAAARRFRLDNGMEVVFLPSGSALPVVTMQLVFQAGSVHEPPDKAGLASVAASQLVSMGEALDAVGADYSASAGTDHTVFTVRGLNIYTEVLIKGLERWIKTGDYSQEGIEKWHDRYRYSIKLKSYARNQTFQRKLREAIYGPSHPYVATGDPRPDTIGNIGRDAAMEFKNEHFTARNATLIVAGNFDEKVAERAIRENFGEWSGGHKDKPVVAPVHDRNQPVYIGIEDDDLPTMQVAIAYPAPAGVDGQYAARQVLSNILNDRMSTVREALGASYGVYGGYRAAVGPGIYLMSGRVDSERAGEALKAMRDGIDALRRGERFEEDFVLARRKLLEDSLTRATDSQSLAGQLAFIARYGLPADFYDKYVKFIAVLSPVQVRMIIEQELRPEREVVVVMGAKDKVKAAFAQAGITSFEWIPDKAR